MQPADLIVLNRTPDSFTTEVEPQRPDENEPPLKKARRRLAALLEQGWYLFVLWGHLASFLQHPERIVVAARGVVEGGKILYLLRVLGILLELFLGR